MRGAAVAVGALLVASGCASAPRPPPAATSARYVFTIQFDNGCPTAAEADVKNCDAGKQPNDPAQRKDCVRAVKGDTIVFEAKPSTSFYLQFDPFKHGTFRPPVGGMIVDTKGAPAGKPFSFNVLSDPPEKCPALDPQIIIN